MSIFPRTSCVHSPCSRFLEKSAYYLLSKNRTKVTMNAHRRRANLFVSHNAFAFHPKYASVACSSIFLRTKDTPLTFSRQHSISKRNSTYFSLRPTRGVNLRRCDPSLVPLLQEYRQFGHSTKILQHLADIRATQPVSQEWLAKCYGDVLQIALSIGDLSTAETIVAGNLTQNDEAKIYSNLIEVHCAGGRFESAVKTWERMRSSGCQISGQALKELLALSITHSPMKGKEIYEASDINSFDPLLKARTYRLAASVFKKLRYMEQAKDTYHNLESIASMSNRKDVLGELLKAKAHERDLQGTLRYFLEQVPHNSNYHSILSCMLLSTFPMETKIAMVEEALALKDIISPLFLFYLGPPKEITSPMERMEMMNNQWLLKEAHILEKAFKDDDADQIDSSEGPFDWLLEETEDISSKLLADITKPDKTSQTSSILSKDLQKLKEAIPLGGPLEFLSTAMKILEHMKHHAEPPCSDTFLLIIRILFKHYRSWNNELQNAICNTLYIMQEENVIPDINFINLLLNNVAYHTSSYNITREYYDFFFDPDHATKCPLPPSPEAYLTTRHFKFPRILPNSDTFAIMFNMCPNPIQMATLEQELKSSGTTVGSKLADKYLQYLSKTSLPLAIDTLTKNLQDPSSDMPRPTASSFAHVIEGLPSKESSWKTIEEIRSLMQQHNIQPDLDVYKAIVTRILPKNIFSQSSSASLSPSSLEKEKEFLQSPTAVEQTERILLLYDEMKKNHVMPDAQFFSYLASLIVHPDAHALEKILMLDIKRFKIDKEELSTAFNPRLIEALSLAGDVAHAEDLYFAHPDTPFSIRTGYYLGFGLLRKQQLDTFMAVMENTVRWHKGDEKMLRQLFETLQEKMTHPERPGKSGSQGGGPPSKQIRSNEKQNKTQTTKRTAKR